MSVPAAALAEFHGQTWAMEERALSAMTAGVQALADGRAPTAARPSRDRQPQAPTGLVGVLPVFGVITHRPSFLSMIFGGASITDLQSALADMLASRVDRIVLLMDTPGGSTAGLEEFAADIREAAKKKPVTAMVDTLAASAGYWLASQANEIVVTPSGEVGSIGVYRLHQDVSRAADEAGITFTFISAGKYKVEGNSYEPLSDEARGYAQAQVDDVYGRFVGDVARGRRVTSQRVRDDFGQGRVVSAREAVRLGMADRIGRLSDVLAGKAPAPVTEGQRRRRALLLSEAAAMALGGEA